MKKALLTIVALLLMSGAMAQNPQTGTQKSKLWRFGGGASWQFINGGGNIDFEASFIDIDFGWCKADGVSANSSAFNVTQPFSLCFGEYFFIRPIIGFGYYHAESSVKVSNKTTTYKTNAFDFLLFPKVGFAIPLKNNNSLTIFASYRYDAPNFKFQGKGCWGAGIGYMFY